MPRGGQAGRYPEVQGSEKIQPQTEKEEAQKQPTEKNNLKTTGRLTSISAESEKALRGMLRISDGRTFSDVWVPRNQIDEDGQLSQWILKQKLEDLEIGPGKDRFGRHVSSSVRRRVKQIGQQLSRIGFIESKKKPDLYFLKVHPNSDAGDVMVFADLRGTEVIPIFEETCPLIWANFDRSFRLESLKKSFDSEILHYDDEMVWSKWDGFGISPGDTEDYFCHLVMHLLELRGIDSRRTHDVFSVMVQEHNEFEETTAAKLRESIVEYNKYLESYQGEVRQHSRSILWKQCRLCGANGLSESSTHQSIQEWKENGVKLEMHHVSYIPEVVIPVCKKCHMKIHHSDEYSHLKPEMARKDWLQRSSRGGV